ncbi:peroxidase 44 [Sorghum bicolor]|uniref:peroxidase 44 n=1 Tax=Sorghum bicolor TaxID=4558 RepID=UPI000B426838|nr:peroxidase 44 [Sorghum bicolor]|eukprot:XP_021318608.1 peroxidase 44 [Sorghum bicolor]
MAAIVVDALDAGYYATTCPDAEAIVEDAMSRLHYTDPTLSPAIIRMLLHDCFVRGCDASVMIVPTPPLHHPATSSERTAVPNHTLRGFTAVDAVKRAVDDACRGGGVDLPAPFAKLADVLDYFAARGFSAEETVVLFGAHTVGGAHCSSFRYRLTGGPGDGTMDETLRRDMLDECGAEELPLETDPAVFFDPDSPFAVDNNFYRQLMSNRTLLQVDQEAAVNPSTAPHVAYYAANPDAFVRRFSEVMAKLSNVGVLEGDAGEVRKLCSRYNDT